MDSNSNPVTRSDEGSVLEAQLTANPPAHSEGRKIRVLLVEDHPLVRAGLLAIEQLDPDLVVVGQAGDVVSGWQQIQERKPDVVLLDIRLSDGSGLELCRRIRALEMETRVICLTSFFEEELVLEALKAGVDGYLIKQSDAARVVTAIRAVLSGATVFDRPVAEVATEGRSATGISALSKGERRVLAGVSEGKTDKEVAANLGLSAKTVRNTLDRIFTKLGIHTRTAAALAYVRGMGGKVQDS